jgi:hypothetical protein
MTLFYKILRTILVTLVLLAIVVPTVAYVLLSLPAVQKRIVERGEVELTQLLGVPVEIGRADIAPFNKVVLNDVNIIVAPGDTALKVARLGAGIRLAKLIMHRRIVFSYAEIIGLDARLSRDSLTSPLNIQPIIDHLQPKDKNKPPTAFDLAIDNIVIRRSSVKYDVLSQPAPVAGKIDFHHLAVSNIKADVRLPRVSNDCYVADLRRLAASERSGLELNSLSGRVKVANTELSVDDLQIELPESNIAFAPLRITYHDLKSLSADLLDRHFALATLPGTHVTPSDFSPFCPALSTITTPVDVELNVEGTARRFKVERLKLAGENIASLEVENAVVSGLPKADSLSVELPALLLHADGHRVADRWLRALSLPEKVVAVVDTLGVIDATVEASAIAGGVSTANLSLTTDRGAVDVDARYGGVLHGAPNGKLTASVDFDKVNIGAVAGVESIGNATGSVSFDGRFIAGKKYPLGSAVVEVDEFEWNGNNLSDITANIDVTNTAVTADVESANEVLTAVLTGSYGLVPGEHDIKADARIDAFNIAHLGVIKGERFAEHSLSGRVEVNLRGRDFDALDGRVELTEIRFADPENSDLLALDHLSLRASGSTSPRFMMLHSDVLDARLDGNYTFASIVPTAKAILAEVFPSLLPGSSMPQLATTTRKTDVEPLPFDMTLDMQVRQNAATDSWLSFFKVPVKLLRPISVKGMINGADNLIELSVDAPNLLNKDKFIDDTYLGVTIDGKTNDAQLTLSTIYPTKKGNATINLLASGGRDSLNVNAAWNIARERVFNGAVELGARFTRLPDTQMPGGMATAIDLRPSRIVINDSVWRMHPSLVEISPNKHISVRDFEVSRSNQFIKINGDASPDSTDVLCLELQNIDLDYVFETLDIGAAMFGGTATGKFYASALMSPEPRLETQRLDVAALTYNHSPLGDAVLASYWDNANRGVVIKADITGEAGKHSYVDGAIFPMCDSLDFRFTAENLNVGFMHPYMAAFTSEIAGHASGKVRLFGTFKDLNIEGDVFAQELRLKLDFTNTYYTTSDSIHITPGRIAFDNVTLRDDFNHTAKLSGWVTHDYFRDPQFEFRVWDARNLMCYDTNEKINPVWYGRIFCNGSAYVKGVPGYIDIDVNMATATGSTFTFVLSDTEAAGEYTFLTMRDRNEATGNLLLNLENPQEAAMRQLKEQIRKEKEQQSGSSVYRINLQVDANPQAEMILVMDPVGGDRIRARGQGSLRMEYNSSDEDLRMFGTYELTQGNYNFTLQDIIIKDFTIKPGSSISFHGDPYSAVLDISAVYSVNANLSDLDESFLQDKDLNRTNVPVHALLKVAGDMRQPDLNFDLEFPTLTQDTYRKVKSIVSTDDMMNRQIIYLLALSRFYTPDFMASTTKGNELVSVASSTISSQLSSMLGQLSDKWNIAPTFRSDRGDFSDVEVDLALSSYLLDNRLLFNGNFGYRDKALNNNSFIGDFDLEYLLNKSGNVRLKAYNRYNDQNYYVKTALTTQGVGVVFKRDFDDLMSWFKRLRRKSAAQQAKTKSATEQPATAQPAE